MSDRFDALFDKARATGGESEIASLAEALAEALEASGDEARRAVEILRKMAMHRLLALRVSAAAVAVECYRDSLRDVVLRLAGDRAGEVREELAMTATGRAACLPDEVVAKLLADDDGQIREKAVAFAAGRPGLEAALEVRLREDGYWVPRMEAAKALRGVSPRTHLPAFLHVLATYDDEDVARECALSAEAAITAIGSAPVDCALTPQALRRAHEQATKHAGGRVPRLVAWLGALAGAAVDNAELAAFGGDLTADAEQGRLARGHGIDGPCRAILGLLASDGPRSIVLLGPSGSGKTALVHELVHRLRDPSVAPGGPWRVIRVSPTDLLAGTLYLGEWQTRVTNLIRAVERPRRVLVYVPDADQLADAGRASGSSLSIGAMLLPYLEKGQLTLLGECTPAAWARSSTKVAGLRRALRGVDVLPADESATLAVLRGVRDECGAEMSEAALQRLIELTGFYLPGVSQPGRSVGLLRRVIDLHRGRPIGPREVLATLSSATGIPEELLDDEAPLDLARVREFFEARVMGQPEAVEAITDLVALVKAGLCDPGKPLGVLLFVGPTGVGKTELARALAERIFGDPARLLRLDMSEFATFESFERLLGRDGDGLLTRPVHDQPFSVVLLDEIEKAHVNVFDLCLQLFDAGRLTDGAGRTVDFRRTIVVLTSNAGAAMRTEPSVGFGGGEPPAPDPGAAQRELQRLFRPEFLNRIDRVVHFRALGLETAERIARRELARMLERSGIARRGLIVDVGPDVVALLLRHGYSRAMGARPLKRTVERMVLLPVARAVSSGGVAPGSALRLRADGDDVRIDVTAQGAAVEEAAPDAAAPAVVRAAADLAARVEGLRATAAEVANRKSAAVTRTGDATVWKDRAAARELMDLVHRLEPVLSAWEALERSAADLLRRARRLPPSGAKGDGLARAVETAMREAERVAALLAAGAVPGEDLGDALVVISRTGPGPDLRVVEQVAKMYAAFARRRGLDVEVMDDERTDDPPEDRIVLHLLGGGAFGTFRDEAGLHVFSRAGRGRRTAPPAEERDAARVDVLPAPGEGDFPGEGVRVDARRLRGAAGRLGGTFEHGVRILDEATLVAASARSAVSKRDAVERAWMLVRALQGAAPPAHATDAIRRRYVLAPSPLVRDLRSGRTTGNANRVLRGELELVL